MKVASDHDIPKDDIREFFAGSGWTESDVEEWILKNKKTKKLTKFLEFLRGLRNSIKVSFSNIYLYTKRNW